MGIVSDLAFIIALGLFMTIDGRAFPSTWPGRRRRVPARSGRRPRDFAHGTRRYLWVSTVFGLIVAVLDTIALFAAGHPGARCCGGSWRS